jgi:hypothetical protein
LAVLAERHRLIERDRFGRALPMGNFLNRSQYDLRGNRLQQVTDRRLCAVAFFVQVARQLAPVPALGPPQNFVPAWRRFPSFLINPCGAGDIDVDLFADCYYVILVQAGVHDCEADW